MQVIATHKYVKLYFIPTWLKCEKKKKIEIDPDNNQYINMALGGSKKVVQNSRQIVTELVKTL